ncbi:MAG: type II toxin-antitoxin system PemK/MazF family toxin [Betaproteobacteria bacterium]
MNLRRGDIVYVAVKGPYTTKPRPVVVVQATATLELMESVTVCPVTSVEVDAGFVRVAVAEGQRSGLDRL